MRLTMVFHQGRAAPVHGDVGEEPMLDLVPLAGTRREVADRDRQAGAIGQLLQLPFHSRSPAPLLPPAVIKSVTPSGPESRSRARARASWAAARRARPDRQKIRARDCLPLEPRVRQ